MQTTAHYDVEDFQADVIERSRLIPVVVDFWAEWCGPCKVLSPILERLASTSDNRWVLAKVDTDAHQDLATTYGIRGIPSVKLFVDGEVMEEFVGALPEVAVRQWLERVLPSPYRKELAKAADLIGDGKTEEAATTLKSIIQKEPENNAARVLMAKLMVFSDPGGALILLENIEAHEEQHAAADGLRTIARLLTLQDDSLMRDESPAGTLYHEGIGALKKLDFPGALRQFIEVVRTDRAYDDDGARKACVAIFRYLGDEHPVSQDYRRDFSSALH